jgi:hypothetical protein
MRHTPCAGTPKPLPPQIQRCLTWAQEHGAKWRKIQFGVEFPPGYTGIQVTEPLLPAEWFIKVPHCLILNSKDTHAELDSVFTAHPEVFQHPYGAEQAKLCAYIISGMKDPDFKWRPFLDCIGHNENLLDWTESELSQLQDEEVYNDIKKAKYSTSEVWSLWNAALSQHPDLFSPEDLSEEVFNHYWRYIENRSFGYCWPYVALVPVAEFINHHSMCSTYYSYDAEDEQLYEPTFEYFELYEDVDEMFGEEDFLLPINCSELVELLKLKTSEAEVLKSEACAVDETENSYSEA